jgi:hypothetical protein
MIGFMATWTTYGTWLQGDKKGYVKKAATKALRKYGFGNNVWTKGFDKRYCYHQHELEMKIKYVQRHEE